MTRAAVRFVVSGRVQGVGFRWFTRDQASVHAVVGWVANADDGTVVGEASAAPDALEAFLAALRDGPPGSTVAGLATTPLTPDAVPAEIGRAHV